MAETLRHHVLGHEMHHGHAQGILSYVCCKGLYGAVMFYDTGKVGKPSLEAAELELACWVARPWVKTSPPGAGEPFTTVELVKCLHASCSISE